MDELRDAIADVILEVTEIEHDCDDFGPISRVGNEVKLADAILADIAASGHSVIATDRLERLIEAGQRYEERMREACGEYLGVTGWCTSVLEPGDLVREGVSCRS